MQGAPETRENTHGKLTLPAKPHEQRTGLGARRAHTFGEAPSPGCREASRAGLEESYSDLGCRPWRRSCLEESWNYRGPGKKHRTSSS